MDREKKITERKADNKIDTLKEELIQLIHHKNGAQSELHTSSRFAEDSVLAFLKEQKERLDELAKTSIKRLRDITDQQLGVITNNAAEFVEHLKRLSDTNCTDEDVRLAEQFVHSCRNGNVLQSFPVNFEGNVEVSRVLYSMKSLGRLNTEETILGGCNLGHETVRKEFYLPVWCRTRCLATCEHSWATSTSSSISDNEVYDTSPTKMSCMSLDSSKGELNKSIDEVKILNISTEANLARYVTEFDAYKHRAPCVIPDITLLPNMNIVLIDHYHNSIQLFDEDFSKLDEKWCPYPIGICRLDDNSVIVSLRRNGQLALFSVLKEKELNLRRNIRVQCESYLWQVKYKSQNVFVVCDENNVHVLDINGIEHCVIRSGVAPECGYLRYFDVNVDSKHMYLSERRGLRCVDFDGKLQWLFTSDGMPEKERDKYGHTIEDVCYYKETILGTHWTLSKIFQISPSGQFLRNLIIDHLEHPRVMSVLGKRLVVTQFHPCMNSVKRRTVKVFHLEI